MKRRRILIGIAALSSFALARIARGQAPAKMPRVVTMTFGSPYNARSRIEAFRKGMLELGYEEGRNVHLEWRSANGQPDLLRDMAQALARENIDVIVSSSDFTTAALVKATKTVPIVMANAEDPVASGFVRSLARPDSNITGLSVNALDQVPRQVELLVKVVPKLTRLAGLMNPTNPLHPTYRSRIEAAARASRLHLVLVDATTPSEVDRAFSLLETKSVGALLVMSDGFFYTERNAITELAERFHLPGMYPHQGFSAAGGLMSYGANIDYNYFRTAAFVDKILKGTSLADLPIEQPTNHELIVNRRAARAIGLIFPPDVLKRANKIIG